MRCRCGSIVTPKWPCKKCFRTDHQAHCHPETDGCEPGCKHDWKTWPHRHDHDGQGHAHEVAA